MRKTDLGLLIFVMLAGMIMISGCAIPIRSVSDVPVATELLITYKLNIVSEPLGADIYINDTLVGVTPSKDTPFPAKINYCGTLGGKIYWPKEHYLLKLSKEGYKNVVEAIEFEAFNVNTWNQEIRLKKKEYNLILERNPQTTNEGSSNEISKAEEIEKYKQLMDKGTITKEEFELKKKQLLGL